MANSPNLSTDAATIYLGLNLKLAHGISSHEWAFNSAAVLKAGENLLIGLPIDSYLPLAREKLHLSYGTLAPPCATIVSLGSHELPLPSAVAFAPAT